MEHPDDDAPRPASPVSPSHKWVLDANVHDGLPVTRKEIGAPASPPPAPVAPTRPRSPPHKSALTEQDRAEGWRDGITSTGRVYFYHCTSTSDAIFAGEESQQKQQARQMEAEEAARIFAQQKEFSEQQLLKIAEWKRKSNEKLKGEREARAHATPHRLCMHTPSHTSLALHADAQPHRPCMHTPHLPCMQTLAPLHSPPCCCPCYALSTRLRAPC